MKKTLLSLFVFSISFFASAQNVILFEDFQADTLPYIKVAATASGDLNDNKWYNISADNNSDGSGGNRPNEWSAARAFATIDALTPQGDSNTVYASNSWCDCPNQNLNYLILPAIYVADTNVSLSWKSAPYQTPRYMDGYTVIISTGTNEHSDQFTDTIFKAAEFISQGTLVPDSGYSQFEFSSGFVHGQDGTYINYHGDSLRFTGELRPFTKSLAAYKNKTIYIAFLHNSTDDNLLSIDDIAVKGNGSVAAIDDPNSLDKNQGLAISPNPANDFVSVNFSLTKSAQTSYQILDLAGNIVVSGLSGYRINGVHKLNLDTQNLSNGTYILNVLTNGNGRLSERFNVIH
jgi:hypothetical protein